MSARRGECEHLLVDSDLVENLLPIADVAVAGDDDVVVPRVVENGILRRVDGGLDVARALLDLR